MRKLIKIGEPQLMFGYGQSTEDPRDGLTLFGPVDNSLPYGIVNGVVGTRDGLSFFKQYVNSLRKPTFNTNNITRPFFPGFEATFRAKWQSDRTIFAEVTPIEINKYLYHEDQHTRIYNLVNLYADRINETIRNEDEKADVWFVIIPEEIYRYGRPQSSLPKELVDVRRTTTEKKAKKMIVYGDSLFDHINQENEPYKYDAHFHNQLKAKLLEQAIPTQVIRESTLNWKNNITSTGQYKRDLSKIEGHLAWCLSTAAFYKTGGRPWKLANIRKGVCYVGLVYKQDSRSTDVRNACCAAQMFLDSGDGTVFKGAVGPWYNDETKEYHLNKSKAKELISLTIDTYFRKEGEYPKELFIHARTRFNKEEWAGFTSAVPKTTNLVGITINDRKALKLYRLDSNFPMLRGLAHVESERAGYLWTKGYVPRLQTSLSLEVPNALFVEISKGDADIVTVLTDILALTKLNYNSCIYGDGIPVTLRFADAIGEILTASPTISTPPLAFKYYI